MLVTCFQENDNRGRNKLAPSIVQKQTWTETIRWVLGMGGGDSLVSMKRNKLIAVHDDVSGCVR